MFEFCVFGFATSVDVQDMHKGEQRADIIIELVACAIETQDKIAALDFIGMWYDLVE